MREKKKIVDNVIRKSLNKLIKFFEKDECTCTHEGGGVYIQKGDIHCFRCMKRKPTYADLIG